jgi:D-alanine-D-alanine ligase
MENAKTIAILHNPVPDNADADERDVLDQVEAVAQSLPLLGLEAKIVPFEPDLAWMKQALGELAPCCIFNLVEAVNGCSQLLHFAPSLFDHLHIPYTGAPAEALFVTTHKVLAKKWMALTDVPTPEWLALESHSLSSPPFPERYIIKPINEEASVGLHADSIVQAVDCQELAKKLRERQKSLDKACFAERFIEGREFNLSLLGTPQGVMVMPPAEMNFHFPAGIPKIMDYKAKWQADTLEYANTQRTFDLPRTDDALVERLKQVAVRCWNLFHLRGYARVDFRVDDTGRVFVLEVNANPCLSEGSGFPAACERAGLSYREMVQRIITEALHRDARQ